MWGPIRAPLERSSIGRCHSVAGVPDSVAIYRGYDSLLDHFRSVGRSVITDDRNSHLDPKRGRIEQISD